jgi:hypothetical protein
MDQQANQRWSPGSHEETRVSESGMQTRLIWRKGRDLKDDQCEDNVNSFRVNTEVNARRSRSREESRRDTKIVINF